MNTDATNPQPNAQQQQRSKNTIKDIRRIQDRVDQLITNLADDFNGSHVRCCGARPASKSASAIEESNNHVRHLIDRCEQLQRIEATTAAARRHKTRTIYIGTAKNAAATIAAMLEQSEGRQEASRRTSESDTETRSTHSSDSDSCDSSRSPTISASSSTLSLMERLHESRAQFGRLICTTHAVTRRCCDHVPGQRFMHGSMLCSSPTAF